MNVWAVTYRFKGETKTLVVENDATTKDGVLSLIHPAISSKVTEVEFVGTLA